MMKKKQNLKRGFSLVEVVVAIGLVALLLVGVMGLMAPASRDIDRALSKEEAKNMAEALITEMNIFRETDEVLEVEASTGVDAVEGVGSSFDKARIWMNESDDIKTAILIYKYGGGLGSVNADGSLKAYKRVNVALDDGTSRPPIQGKDYVVNTVARRKSDSLVTGELVSGVVTGKVYVARFKKIEVDEDDGELKLLDEHVRKDNVVTEWNGTLIAQMEIYALKSNSKTYIDKLTDLNKLGKPLYTKNVVFRR